MADQPEAPASGIPIEQVARLLTISPRRVQQLAAEDYIPRAADGRYPIVGAVQGYIRSLRDDLTRESKSAQAKRLQEVKAQEVEIRIAERQRALVTVAEAQDAMDSVCGLVRSELVGMPARVHRNPAERLRLETEVEGILVRLADRLTEESRALSEGGGGASALAEDDAGSVGEAE